jgi:hypothetical protein
MTRSPIGRQALPTQLECHHVRELTACPKCQRERRPGDSACPRCGLVVTRWSGWVATVSAHPVVDDGWRTLRESWEDDAAHRRFLEACAGVDALDLAAARYREELRLHPSSSRAEAGLRRAASLAESLYAQRAQADRIRTASPWFRAVGFVFAGVILLGLLLVIAKVLRR